MKIILGDNQFFGINHFDLKKGEIVKSKFDSGDKIYHFIKSSLELGMDGFMINSNDIGYNLLNSEKFDKSKEIHYSIPYPHKYANMVNENGLPSLLTYAIKNTSMLSNLSGFTNFLLSKNIAQITPIAIDLEIPKNLPKGSYIYLQNIITDLIMGMGRFDVLKKFIQSVIDKGHKPGLITLNPIILQNELLNNLDDKYFINDLIVCFNINKSGFNVFPDRLTIEKFIESRPRYKLMGMSIFASGSSNIKESIEYIKKLNLDYIVFGTSKIENLKSNINLFSVK